MDEEIECCCEEKHAEHICVLRGKGLVCRVKSLTGKPNVICGNCNNEADSEDNVCRPIPMFI
jgi:hypothetical protein